MLKILQSSVRLTYIFFALAATIACDPGMTIRQAPSNDQASSLVTLHVKPRNQLVGEKFYAPLIEIANAARTTITITRAELEAEHTTIQNAPDSGNSVRQIPALKTETVGFWFGLPDNVRQTFREPVQLTVYYTIDSKEQIATTTIVGGPLEKSEQLMISLSRDCTQNLPSRYNRDSSSAMPVVA